MCHPNRPGTWSFPAAVPRIGGWPPIQTSPSGSQTRGHQPLGLTASVAQRGYSPGSRHAEGFPGLSGQEPSRQCRRNRRRGFGPWVGKIPLKKEMATQSSTLAWRIPWTEEPGGLQSTGSQRVGLSDGSHTQAYGKALLGRSVWELVTRGSCAPASSLIPKQRKGVDPSETRSSASLRLCS